MSVHKIDLQSISLVNKAFMENIDKKRNPFECETLKEFGRAIKDFILNLAGHGKIDLEYQEREVKQHLSQTAFAVAKAGISKDDFMDLVKSEYTLKTCRPRRFDENLDSLYSWTRAAFDEALEKLNSQQQELVDDSDMDELNLPEVNSDVEVEENSVRFNDSDVDVDEPSVSRSDQWEREMENRSQESQDERLERWAKLDFHGVDRSHFR